MNQFEVKAGVTIAVFAALMSISDLFAGKFGNDQIIKTNEKAAAYNWYQSKSIKQTLVEGQQDLLQSLLDEKAIISTSQIAVQSHIENLDKKIKKYEKEKQEILLGSAKVGEENWVQEKDGVKGQIIGAQEIEAELIKLEQVGDHFDLASLFYQLSLVFGAISIVLKKESLQEKFFYFMILLGLIGTAESLLAFKVVM